MKKIYKLSYLLLFTLVISFIGCDDTSETLTASNNPTAPVLNDITIKDIKLDAVNVNTAALTLNWESANYDVQTPIIYNIEFANDENFTSPILGSSVTGKNAITFSMGELNTNAGNAGLNPFEWSSLYVRVTAALGSQSGISSPSNTIELNVFPFFNYVFNDYYVVGDATSPGWDNNNNNPALFRDPNDEKLYTYTGFFGDGKFKILETKGLWQPQWGTNDGSSIDVNPGGGDDPKEFPDAGKSNVTPGFYTFTINFSTKTYTIEPFDATGITSPTSLSIQGSSTAGLTALNPLTFDGHIWYANAVKLVPGDLQFITEGGTVWGSDTSFSGVATSGGTNIPVIVEDDYDVWFNDLTGQYILIPLNL